MVQFGPKGPKTVKSEKREMKYVIPFLDIATSRVGTARCHEITVSQLPELAEAKS